MNRRRPLLIPLIALSAASGVALSSPARSALTRMVYMNTIAIGGTELITLRGETKEEVDRRADIVGARLNLILGDSTLSREDIQVKFVGKEQVIFAKDKRILTVTLEDARYNQTTVSKQAQAWCARLGEVLPTLKANDNPPPH